MTTDPVHLSTDVLVMGAGAAGMYASIAASRNGADVILVDKNLIGRGGATIMAQMTVAAAVGEQEPDTWEDHYADTLTAGRGLCNERLAAILCEEAVERIYEMDGWGVGWARDNGHMIQVMAPGHSVQRCVYVDFLNTGPAVAKCLRTKVAQGDNIRRISGVGITDLVVNDGTVTGAVGYNQEDGTPVTIAAKAVILAGGGLTGIYRRNSASLNMGGDSYALALRAGAELTDMEFVQFFPIGHLAPRLVGMDPIMWDPFRYKLGGRLFNGKFEEFLHNYGEEDSGTYTAPRDITSFAIMQEDAAGRGSPHGGAWLSFEHVPEDDLRAAFGPVIDRLLNNGIDLTKQGIEVSPIAHYHMGGVRVDEQMATRVQGLYAAGEAVGGA
ncbi:MAG: succinate dehydrogenase, partial [Rhodospirillaceae bacterium]|nr:succinate dehydrogenase [Rhodospirillaceae bacterium]